MQESTSGATGGSGFISNFFNNMPYRKGSASLPNIEELNPKFPTFNKSVAQREIALKKRSVSTPANIIGGEAAVRAFFSNSTALLYQSANEQKTARIREYDTLGSYDAVKEALEEIANEFFNPDDKGRIAECVLTGKDDKPETKERILNEFEKYIGYFNFDDNGSKYIKNYLKHGELFFEHIIDPEWVSEGVLGVMPVATNMIDPLYVNVVTEDIEAFIFKRPIYDINNPNTITGFDLIPMSKGQIVYMHTDEWNVEHTFRLPHIDSCRKAFRQLSMLEDSILIYRMVNAPERLVFNIDVGNMPAPKAEEYLQRMSQEYWSNRSFDPSKGDITNQMNPQGMLDAFWFPKRTGSEGSKVEKLAGGQNLGELQDLNYFAQKLYKSLKVPTSRLQSDNTYRDGTDILREELKFATFIIDIQKQFARAIKLGFITHLKLKGWMSEMDIFESDIKVKFFPPTNFYEMREAKRLEIRIGNFNNITADGSISKTFAQKKYLKYSDEEIQAINKLRRLDAANDWEIAQIAANGPKWYEIAAASNPNAAGGAAPAPAAGGGGGGGGGLPPDFGGGAVDVAGGASAADGLAQPPANPGANPTGAAFGTETQSESPDAGAEGDIPNLT